MRLTDKQVKEMEESGFIYDGLRKDLLDTIEDLQQENDQLKYEKETAEKQVEKYVNEINETDKARELIPKICKYYDGWSCQAYQGKDMGCPQICGNWEGSEQ